MSGTDASFGLLSGLTTGGIGGVVIAVLIFLYRCLQKKRIKSHSGCIDFEISEEQPREAPKEEVPAPPPTPVMTATAPVRTPVPSMNLEEKKGEMEGLPVY